MKNYKQPPRGAGTLANFEFAKSYIVFLNELIYKMSKNTSNTELMTWIWAFFEPNKKKVFKDEERFNNYKLSDVLKTIK